MDCLAPLDDPALLSVLAYFASSLVMIPLNREAAAAHPYTFILACFQCALTVLLLALTPLCCTRARWLLGTEVADDLLRTNTDLKPAAAEADGPAPAADEEQGGIAPAAITFNWEVDGVTRELTVPDGASPDDEREFSFVAADGSTRYFVARIPGSLAPAAARPRSKRGLWRFMRR